MMMSWKKEMTRTLRVLTMSRGSVLPEATPGGLLRVGRPWGTVTPLLPVLFKNWRYGFRKLVRPVLL